MVDSKQEEHRKDSLDHGSPRRFGHTTPAAWRLPDCLRVSEENPALLPSNPRGFHSVQLRRRYSIRLTNARESTPLLATMSSNYMRHFETLLFSMSFRR